VVWTWPAQAEPAVGWWVWSVDGITTTSSTLWEAEGDFTVRILDSMTGCADSTQVHVNVLPNLDVDAAPFAGIVCWDATTEIQAEIRAVEGTDIDELPYTWAWDDPDVEGLNPTVGAGVYLIEAENACGRDVALVQVTQEYCGCDMWMPTAFTPDNDGINDGLKLETNCPELDEFRLEIYNRWGQRVWITEDPERTWMGQSETPNSEGLHFAPDGVYGYRLYWKYGELGVPIVEERTGHLQLLR
jgi:gliding motility-associated-like protein